MYLHPGVSLRVPGKLASVARCYTQLMCGRFVTPGQQVIERVWHVRGTDGLFSARYNVAPTTQIPIVYIDRHDGDRRQEADKVYREITRRFADHPLAEIAKMARNKIANEQLHDTVDGLVRMDAVFYMQGAMTWLDDFCAFFFLVFSVFSRGAMMRFLCILPALFQSLRIDDFLYLLSI